MVAGRTGRPIPNPGIAALPHAAAGSSARAPASRASARSIATSGSSASPPVPRPRSAPVGSPRSPNGSAWPTIVTTSPGSRRASRYDRAAPLAAPDQPSAGASRTWTRSRSSICAAVSGSAERNAPLGPQRQPGRLLAEQARPVLPALGRLDPGIAREDPELAGVVADAEADGPLLDEPAAPGRAVAVLVDDRAVVDARHALEPRDEGHLGGFDDPADADLAGRDRRDRRGRRVGDPGRDPVPAHAASEEREAADDPHAGHRSDRGDEGHVHRGIVREPAAHLRAPATVAAGPRSVPDARDAGAIAVC